MRLLILLMILLHATTAVAVDQDDSLIVRHTVRKALDYLAHDMRVWRAQQGCASCHHGPMYLWASHVARQNGYRVDDPYVAEMTEWLMTNDEARIFRQPSADKPAKLSQATIFLAQALQVVPRDNPFRERGQQRVVEHLRAARHTDHWMGSSGRPPIFNTPQILTRQAALALALHEPTLAAEANRWIAAQPADETHQGLVLRLWAAADQSPKNFAAVDQLVARLAPLQRPDGGWSQTDELASDAFATGQTLFAFHRAGLTVADARVRRAAEFLARTQLADGSWPMTSRPDPETGERAEFLDPITYAATAWSVLGLSGLFPDQGSRGRDDAIAKLPPSAIPRSKSPVDCPIGDCPGVRFSPRESR